MRAILTYHSIDDSGSPISIDRETFRAHVAWLAKGTVQVVGLEDLVALHDAADAVALTFDDGFVNFEEEAAPLLEAHGMVSTLFVVTDHVGRTNAWNDRGDLGVPRLPLLDWGALARLGERGVRLGGHTRRHPQLTALHGSMLIDEVLGARERLEMETGVRPTSFAYPYGDLNDEVVQVVSGAFQHACTTELRSLGPDENAMRLPRLDAYYFRTRGDLEKWGSLSFRCRLKLRAEARRVRRVLHAVRGREG